MHINWFGQNCFKIVTKNATLVCDSFDKELGLKPLKTSANIVTLSSDSYTAKNIKDHPLVFNTPGEYESKNTLIRGIESYQDGQKGKKRGMNTIFTIEAEGIRICHLGNLGHGLSDETESKIDGVDILLVPIGNTDVIDSKAAKKIIQQIEPSIIIPMHYNLPGLKPELSDAKGFLKEMGKASLKPQPKLRISKKDIPVKDTEVILLSKS